VGIRYWGDGTGGRGKIILVKKKEKQIVEVWEKWDGARV